MDIQTLTFIFVGGTFLIYIGIAIWSRAGTTDDFYVAGGGVPPLANGMATAADWMSAASFISMADARLMMSSSVAFQLVHATASIGGLALCGRGGLRAGAHEARALSAPEARA